MAGHTTFRGKLVPRKLWSKFVNKVDIDHKIELSWPLIYRGSVCDQAFTITNLFAGHCGLLIPSQMLPIYNTEI